MKKKKTHCHNGYPNQTLEQTTAKSVDYVREFEAIQPLVMERGIHVVNMNPCSGITCFRYGIIAEVFKNYRMPGIPA